MARILFDAFDQETSVFSYVSGNQGTYLSASGITGPGSQETGIFVADAESGDLSAFTGTLVNGTNVFSVSSDFASHGNRSYKVSVTGGGAYSAAYKAIPARNEIWARFYLKLANVNFDAYTQPETVTILDSTDGYSANLVASVAVRRDSGTPGPCNAIFAGGSGISGLVAATLNPDTWYCLELHWRRGSGDGIYEAFLDGTRVINLTGLTTDAYTPAAIFYGCVGGASVVRDDYIDDCKFDFDGYIGPYFGGGPLSLTRLSGNENTYLATSGDTVYDNGSFLRDYTSGATGTYLQVLGSSIQSLVLERVSGSTDTYLATSGNTEYAGPSYVRNYTSGDTGTYLQISGSDVYSWAGGIWNYTSGSQGTYVATSGVGTKTLTLDRISGSTGTYLQTSGNQTYNFSPSFVYTSGAQGTYVALSGTGTNAQTVWVAAPSGATGTYLATSGSGTKTLELNRTSGATGTYLATSGVGTKSFIVSRVSGSEGTFVSVDGYDVINRVFPNYVSGLTGPFIEVSGYNIVTQAVIYEITSFGTIYVSGSSFAAILRLTGTIGHKCPVEQRVYASPKLSRYGHSS